VSAKGKSSLGRGLDVLISADFDKDILEVDQNRVQKLFISAIEPNPDQPRKHFEQEALEQLAESIQRHGILQPLIVTHGKKADSYVIIAGERRWRASKIAGLEKVPAIVRSSQELEQLELAMVENIQRVDLSPLEQAASIQRLHDQFSLGYEQIAQRLGKAVSTLNNIVRLLQLTPAAQQALQEQRITEGHARALLALKPFPKQQEELLLLIQKNGWSVRQAEQFVTATKAGMTDSKQARVRTQKQTPETKMLSKRLHVPVTIQHMAKGGRLMLNFTDEQDLQRIIDMLGKL
jgi:ParB family chromosome partitioning protein